MEIYTIGHSNHNLGVFLHMLRKYEIDVLVDVRSEPYSRYASQFNKSEFERYIESEGIEYKYSGAGIGGKPKDQSLYTQSGAPDYDRLASMEEFKSELEMIAEMAERKRIALMCSEADPMGCHRERLLARVLRSWGIRVIHILPDGTLRELSQLELI